MAAEKGVQDALDGRGPLDGQEEGAAHKHEEPAACGTLWPPLGAKLRRWSRGPASGSSCPVGDRQLGGDLVPTGVNGGPRKHRGWGPHRSGDEGGCGDGESLPVK